MTNNFQQASLQRTKNPSKIIQRLTPSDIPQAFLQRTKKFSENNQEHETSDSLEASLQANKKDTDISDKNFKRLTPSDIPQAFLQQIKKPSKNNQINTTDKNTDKDNKKKYFPVFVKKVEKATELSKEYIKSSYAKISNKVSDVPLTMKLLTTSIMNLIAKFVLCILITGIFAGALLTKHLVLLIAIPMILVSYALYKTLSGLMKLNQQKANSKRRLMQTSENIFNLQSGDINAKSEPTFIQITNDQNLLSLSNKQVNNQKSTTAFIAFGLILVGFLVLSLRHKIQRKKNGYKTLQI